MTFVGAWTPFDLRPRDCSPERRLKRLTSIAKQCYVSHQILVEKDHNIVDTSMVTLRSVLSS